LTVVLSTPFVPHSGIALIEASAHKTQRREIIYMPQLKVAHIREQGSDMIIIPLNSSFGSKGLTEQRATIAELESRAHSAGLAGHVVVVWDCGGGLMRFVSPSPWAAFFRSISLDWVWQNVNRTLDW
jgi:hypothetical protein